MKIELTEVTWLDEQVEYTLDELAERSHLAHAEILELIDCGAISPGDGRALQTARTAARLRSDFEINVQGVAPGNDIAATHSGISRSNCAALRAHRSTIPWSAAPPCRGPRLVAIGRRQ